MVISLDGRRTTSFPAFVDEMNRALAPVLNEPWNGTLDALADLLNDFDGRLVWTHADAARDALGYAAMTDWLETRVDFVHPTNRPDILARLVEARHGHGPTLFEMLYGLMSAVLGKRLVLEA
ncbi:MAG: hypothetical protein LCH53_00365 [Bacteroidetes bacterium]|nr:hypothetical protein [Bacteroidota bacterium]